MNATTAVPVYSVFLFAAGVIGFVCSWLNNNPIIAWSAVTGITSNGVLFTCALQRWMLSCCHSVLTFVFADGFPCFLRITASLRTFKGAYLRPKRGCWRMMSLQTLPLPVTLLAGHPDFSLGRWSIPVAVLGVTYVLASQGTSAFRCAGRSSTSFSFQKKIFRLTHSLASRATHILPHHISGR